MLLGGELQIDTKIQISKFLRVPSFYIKSGNKPLTIIHQIATCKSDTHHYHTTKSYHITSFRGKQMSRKDHQIFAQIKFHASRFSLTVNHSPFGNYPSIWYGPLLLSKHYQLQDGKPHSDRCEIINIFPLLIVGRRRARKSRNFRALTSLLAHECNNQVLFTSYIWWAKI